MMQSTKASRGGSKESPQKASPRPVRQLKVNPSEHSSSSSSNHAPARTPKNISPKVMERKSPRSPISEKKRPSKLSELESQISQLQSDLKKVKDQLVISESSKREAEEDAEQVKKKLADVSLKLEESQKQVSMLVSCKEAGVVELQSVSLEKKSEYETRIESAREQQKIESDALECARNEILRLKQQLEQGTHRESTNDEMQSMKCSLDETIALVESLKIERNNCKESEARAKDLARETQQKLEAAKETVDALRLDVNRSKEAYSAIVSELEQSRERVNFLEDVVSKLNAMELGQLESELQATKSAMETTDLRYNEERSQNEEKMRNVVVLLEEIKVKSGLREAELKGELKKASAYVEELKAKLLDKETQLQCISEENENLNLLEKEVKELRKHVAEVKANVMDKENQVQNMMEENEMLKSEIKSRETDKDVVADVAASRAAEQDAVAKIGCMMEEIEKSKSEAMRVAEQLEAAQAANTEMEAELRRVKVQSDQWRKAAEAAASMLSPVSNGKCVERTGSMPLKSNYSPIGSRLGSPFLDDFDDKKKNGNVLKKIGVLWRKPQK